MATSLEISKKRGPDRSSAPKTLSFGKKIVKIGLADLEIAYFGSEQTSSVWHKIGCHGNGPWGIGKTGQDQENSRKFLPFGGKIVKIGPVDTEIALLIVKKEEITEGKIYSPVGKFAERLKNTKTQ